MMLATKGRSPTSIPRRGGSGGSGCWRVGGTWWLISSLSMHFVSLQGPYWSPRWMRTWAHSRVALPNSCSKVPVLVSGSTLTPEGVTRESSSATGVELIW